MVNVFVSNPDPVKSVDGLDDKRLPRMTYESFDLLSSAIINSENSELMQLAENMYVPPMHHQKHPAAYWVEKDLLHFKWLLDHAHELNRQYKRRYEKTEDYKSYRLMYATARKAMPYLPRKTYKVYDGTAPIQFEGYFNFNEFKETYSKKHPGKIALPQSTDIFTRYRLSLLHKYLYLDERTSTWQGRKMPLWLFNPIFREWLVRQFGMPKQEPAHLIIEGDKHYEALDFADKYNSALLNLRSISYTLGPVNIQTAYTRDVYSTAVFDINEMYRYFLSRQWSHELPLVVVMLNPSTADAFNNDPTVAIIEKIAKRDGYGGYVVLNMAAFRATDPDDMLAADDFIGPHNYQVIECTLQQIIKRWRMRPSVLLAYGATVNKMSSRNKDLTAIRNVCAKYGNLLHLGVTKDGHARHPLYMKQDLPLIPYTGKL